MQKPQKPQKPQESIEDLIYSLYKTKDIGQYVQLILQRFHNLSIYVIEPYIPQNTGEPLKIPAGDNYTIYDYGGRLVVTINDILSAPLFAFGEFLAAIEAALQILLDASAQEIAILGDQRGKLFIWDRCDKLETLENIIVKIVNFAPPETFGITREAVMEYLKSHGMGPPKTRPTPLPPG
jgi:hypothetical protein